MSLSTCFDGGNVLETFTIEKMILGSSAMIFCFKNAKIQNIWLIQKLFVFLRIFMS